jgi:hypothetical protein
VEEAAAARLRGNWGEAVEVEAEPWLLLLPEQSPFKVVD